MRVAVRWRAREAAVAVVYVWAWAWAWKLCRVVVLVFVSARHVGQLRHTRITEGNMRTRAEEGRLQRARVVHYKQRGREVADQRAARGARHEGVCAQCVSVASR